MSLQQMYQAMAQKASFAVGFNQASYSIFDIGFFPGDARAEIQIRANGDVWAQRLNGADGVIGSWVTGSGFDANDYDFQWVTTGNNPNWGPSDPISPSWVNGGGTIVWGAEETGAGTFIATGVIHIRPAGGGADIDTATATLNAESTP